MRVQAQFKATSHTLNTWQLRLCNEIGLLEQGHTPPKKPWNGVETATGTSEGWTLNFKLEDLHRDSTIHVSEAISDLSSEFSSASMVSDDFNAETVINTILNPIFINTSPGMILNPKSSVDSTRTTPLLSPVLLPPS
jgi:hypothetical protein